MTVSENIIFFSKFRQFECTEEVINEQLELFNLYNKKDALASNLSGG
jgi:ABC-type multidrug transport system ATPase subunit